jgi:hypothetical protein
VLKRLREWLFGKESKDLNINVKVTGTLKLHWADVLQISQDPRGASAPESRGQGLPGPSDSEHRRESTIEIPANIQLPKVKFGQESE